MARQVGSYRIIFKILKFPRIRTPRATNEARQNAIRETLREAAIGLAHKADKQQANVILG